VSSDSKIVLTLCIEFRPFPLEQTSALFPERVSPPIARLELSGNRCRAAGESDGRGELDTNGVRGVPVGLWAAVVAAGVTGEVGPTAEAEEYEEAGARSWTAAAQRDFTKSKYAAERWLRRLSSLSKGSRSLAEADSERTAREMLSRLRASE
jgi:hypothetical protein